MPAGSPIAARKLALALAVVVGLLVMHGSADPSAHATHAPTELAPSGHDVEVVPAAEAAHPHPAPLASATADPSQRPQVPPPDPIAHSVALCLAVLAALASFLAVRRVGASTVVARVARGRPSSVRAGIRPHQRGDSPQALLCVQLC